MALAGPGGLPVTVWLCHRDCPATGECLAIGGGFAGRVALAYDEGWRARPLTPETVRDAFAVIMGDDEAVDEGHAARRRGTSLPRLIGLYRPSGLERATTAARWRYQVHFPGPDTRGPIEEAGAMALFGLRFDLRNPPIAGTSMTERYRAAIDMAEWADASASPP